MTVAIDRFQELEACYGRLLSWCDLLEAISDFLPCRVDPRLCEAAARELMPLMAATHHMEEQFVSANLGLIMTDAEQVETEERQNAGRLSDAAAAQELVAVLTALKAGSCDRSWEAISYLLRSFTGDVRGHIGEERVRIGQIRFALSRKINVSESLAEEATRVA